MISHQYKCIFVEVPKTGSTSVRRILGRAIKPHMSLSEIRRLMESYWVVRGGRKDRIMEWLYPMLPAEQRKERGRRQFESYFKFGFVRNPWDRVVSLYERNEAVQMRQQMSFEEFVRWIQYSSSTCVVGRFERLREDWAVIAKKLGVSEALPHTRGNPRLRHYTEYYTAETQNIIKERFRVDIETFNYRFGD
jgi:hypothetical protein